ncbi:MAG: cytochrome c biogenesis protein CcdA [Bacillota bacterium]
MPDVSLGVAFLAGLASFISPCVLAIVPVYLTYLAGGRPQDRGTALSHALLFVVGFSTVFVTLGLSASAAGALLTRHLFIIKRVGGAFVIAFGVHRLGLIRWGPLYAEKRFSVRGRAGLWTSFLMGLAFSFGWSPCVGPILAAILLYAATSGGGLLLLVAYSAGLAVPFLLSAIFVDRLAGVIARARRWSRVIDVVSGLLLIAVGWLIFTDRLRFLTQLFPS